MSHGVSGRTCAASSRWALASVLWGTGGLAVQLIREQEALSPVTISAWRMAIAAAVLLVALLALRRGGELVALARATRASCWRSASAPRPTRASTSSPSPRSASPSRPW